ncbi:MAG: ArnT family glycosyltransferase [bacterium]
MKSSTSRFLFLLICCLAAGVAVRLGFINRPLERLADFPLLDDSFYSLNIARNIAAGRGMTHDRVHRTNGFQPLYVFLAVPLYLMYPQDPVTPIRLMLLFSVFLSAFTGVLLFKTGRLIKNERVGIFAGLLWFLSPCMIEHDINGLETGLYAFLLVAVLYYYLSRIRKRSFPANRRFVYLGVLAGLMVLARIDGLIFVAGAGLDFLVVSGKRLKNETPVVLKQAGLFIFFMILTVSPWFLNNAIRFHSLMPVSGQAVRFLSRSSHASTYQAAGDVFPIDPLPPGYYWHNLKFALVRLNRNPLIQTLLWIGLFFGVPKAGYLLVLLGLLVIGWLARRDPLAFEDYFTVGAVRGLFFTLLFSLVLVASYIFYVFGQWYYVRYFFPVQVIGLLYSGLLFDFTCEALSDTKRKAVFVSLTAALLLITFGLRLKDRYEQYDPAGSYYQSALWLNRKVPPGKTVGVFQSGAIGYFSRARIINLDGVVNGKAFAAMKEKRMFRYLKEEKVDFVFDWPWMIDHYLVKSSTGKAGLRIVEKNGERCLYEVLHEG